MNFSTKTKEEVAQEPPVQVKTERTPQEKVTDDMMHDIVKETGWTPRYQVELLCAFIDSIGQRQDLATFLESERKKDNDGRRTRV